ncbi:hypothetical protein KI688_005963 [Linnemannia hyalina]|uniref:Ion transport domain-containing protein n=1 Tax=Linnemannia hyalina TaxID=64524 RepID=A0A9P7Y3S9_9FUNG|nr:hypothetical protein KI688_005963 [Linnemannia hyalina]
MVNDNDLRNMKTNPRIPKVRGAIKLRLHQQVFKSSKEESKGDIKFIMDIRTLSDAKVDSGSIVMYYMETCRNVFGDDISVMLSNGSLDVAVSWNASMIALLDISPVRVAHHTKQDTLSMFRVFTHERNDNVNQQSQSLSRCNLKRVDCRPDLKTYIGNGRFHFASNPGAELDKELFITCDGKALNLYSPFKQWSHIRRIPLDEESSLGYYDLGAALSKHLRGSHLALTSRSKQHVTVWDVEQGAVASFTDRPTTNTFALSSDGLLMVFVHRHHINLHSANTGAMIGACHLEELTNKHLISSVSFIEGDKRIMAETNYEDPNLGPQHLGFIIDTTTLVVEDRYFLPPRVFSHHASVDSERLVCLHHYTLDLIHLKDRIVSTPASLQRTRCDNYCTDQLSAQGTLPTVLLVPSSGLHFKAQKLPASASSPGSVAITASKNSNPSEEKLIFQVPGNYDIAAFLPSHSCLVVQRSSLIMIWKLPRTISGNHQLILVHSLGSGLAWRVCREQRIFSHGLHPNTSEMNVYLNIEHPFTLDNSEYFMGGMAALVQMFADANETYRSHIFQYLGRHINTYPDPRDTLTSVLGHICSAWSPDAHELYCSFLKALLYSPSTRRIPRPDLEKTWNPLMIFLDLSKKNAQAIALAEIIIDYCIDTAKANRDPSFLAPVSRSLATLVERNGPHSELALKTLRGFAYVPVSHRSYVIEHPTWPLFRREHSLGCLFELRVVKSVCHFVTIIIQVIRAIRVFFLVFAAGLLGFTIAILHLLRGCVNSSCSNLSEGFPTNFLESILAVYFVMGGRYDPFDNNFKSGGFAFHFILIVFFFFTVILMLNVLIALINLAFNDGDQTWRLTWLENRMRYVESAENMTYIHPVFYSATPQQVRDYDRETKQLIEDFAPTVARPDGASKGGGGEDDNTSMQLHFEQKRAIDELRSELKCGLKEDLQSLRDENALLRVQVSELQLQLTTLPGEIVALLRAYETQPGRTH